MDASTLLLIGIIVLACACVSSIAGFAFSALAGSLLFQVTPDRIYVLQVMLVASISVQTYSVWKLRGNIRVADLVPYFLGGLPAIPPGIYLLLSTPLQLYFTVLGVFLVAYAAFALLRPPIRLRKDFYAGRVLVGALGGIAGATAAFPGAFVTVWCSAQEWDKVHQRAIYQPFILVMQLATLIALLAIQPPQAMRLDAVNFALPALVGAYVGVRIFEGLSTSQFNRVVASLLLVAGIALSLKGGLL